MWKTEAAKGRNKISILGRIARRVRQSFNDGIKTSEQGRSWWWRACLLANLQRDATCQWEE